MTLNIKLLFLKLNQKLELKKILTLKNRFFLQSKKLVKLIISHQCQVIFKNKKKSF